MSVKIRYVENKDFTTSIYLDIYQNGKRYKEFLKDCKLVKPKTPRDRTTNKAKETLAELARAKRELQLAADEQGVMNNSNKVEFKPYFENYINNYTKKDKRNVEGVYNKFLAFVKGERLNIVTLKQIDESIVQDFADYLKSISTGEGASSYFARFKKVLRRAVKDKHLQQSPAEDITIERDNTLKKDILTIAEIQTLASTDISNTQIKKAFLFSCFTGLRWVDVVGLQWKHIDLSNQVLNKVQTKTDVKVSVTLNTTALALLPPKTEKQDYVFSLPSHTGALKTLRNWLKKAEIEKHITWHCARHSFATNLIVYETDLLIVSKLLGHTSTTHTQRYTQVANDLKKKATDSLPSIHI